MPLSVYFSIIRKISLYLSYNSKLLGYHDCNFILINKIIGKYKNTLLMHSDIEKALHKLLCTSIQVGI